ncbi:MAG: recombination mediator RecR [Odoribacteraceae bacterium]|jgi:recombination protein RecR|nr:recombination mediator RecR [Odoribacteraceae bacterium]
MLSLSSRLVEKAVEQFATLPGIGRKTALRFTLHLLRQDKTAVDAFIDAFRQLKESIRECKYCHNIADGEACEICLDARRDATIICVVENIQDVISIESTGQFRGVYHVLGGIISPVDGIGPGDLHVDTLLKRVEAIPAREVIFALGTTIEGETTAYYIFKKLPRKEELVVTTLARGIAVGNELEYIDELTLGRSITHRIRFEP